MTNTLRITEAQRRLLVSACRRTDGKLFRDEDLASGKRRSATTLIAKGLVEGSMDAPADLRVADAAFDLLQLPKPSAGTSQPAKSRGTTRKPSKRSAVLERLAGRDWANLVDLQQATGWQPHSVRGFLSGTVRKSLGLNLVSFVGDDGERRYRIEEAVNG